MKLCTSARAPGRDSAINLEQRASRAAESILENESLTSDLDDVAAKVLLDWGLACAKAIAQSTAGLDDAQAGEVMSSRLRATRRLMRSVNKWIANREEMDAVAKTKRLSRVIEQASIIYGPEFSVPAGERCDAFLRHIERVDDPARMIADLREFVENPGI